MIKENICKNCPLYELNLKKVFEEVKGNPNLLFLGANPGKEEAIQGKPFVGKSGRLLRNYINKYFNDYIIFNSILCSTNNTSEISNISKVISICSNYTLDIINKYNIKYIVCLGKIAIDTIRYIFNIRKAFKPSKFNYIGIYNGITIFSTPHPSYIVRGSLDKNEYEIMFKIINRRINNND